MKVIDVEQVYLGYAVRRPNGRAAADQHAEIEMGADEGSKVGMGGTVSEGEGKGMVGRWMG